MTIDLLFCSVKELMIKKKRTLLTIMAIIVSSIFITSFIGAGSSIKAFLFASIDESAVTKQIIVKNENNTVQLGDIDRLKEETGAKDTRVYLNYYVADIAFDNDLFRIASPRKIKFYDSNYSLFTHSELKSAELKYGTEYNKFNSRMDGAYITENVLVRNKITNTAEVLGKQIQVVFLDPVNKKETTCFLPIKGIIPAGMISIMDTTQVADIVIPSGMINEKPRSIESITYDYEDYHNIRSIEKIIESQKLSVTSHSKQVQDIQAESIIYNTILTLAGCIIILATVFTVYNALNISFKERVKYFGMLKAIGFNTFHIYCICILQSLIMNVVGASVGGIISNTVGGILGMYLAKGIFLDNTMTVQGNVFGTDWSLFLISIAVLLLSGVVAGIFPAIKTSRKSPINALSVEK